MCGILGIATTRTQRVTISDDAASRLRDLMIHRGPDGAGLWRSPAGNVLLGHRRLAVVDPGPGGAQPRVAGDGQHALVYNGELYNDHELRRELAAMGVACTTACDTETVLAALMAWGIDALARFRGMFALAWHDVRNQRIVLARDPFGIKPLYFWIAQGDRPTLVFASEVTPILAHPDVPVRPDMVGVSAYLTTIRTVLGRRTMFEGVRTLRPGEALEIDLTGDEFGLGLHRHHRGAASSSFAGGDGVDAVRDGVRESVRVHMRADVPTCALLSGGLDSSAIVACVAGHGASEHWSHRTYCSGALGGVNSDFEHARVVAQRFATTHTEAPVARGTFRERWHEMVQRLGTPLSTPNEVAINEVARRLRADGQVVALSGEGADELFAGYDQPLVEAAAFEAARAGRAGAAGGGEHQLNANAWVAVQVKGVLLTPGAWRGAEQDTELRAFYADEFAEMEEECGDARGVLDAHLRFHRRINLAGLLQRLDTATMLESVEGRTPFADRVVAGLAESLAFGEKFDAGPPARTKIVLREAFRGVLPVEVVERPKASFPLPFQEWVADRAADLRESAAAREIFAMPAIEMVASDPCRHWRAAWPMINVAMWARRWWG